MPSDADTAELREAIERHGCAVCFLSERAMLRFMRSVAYEQVNDPALRARLRATKGFCTTHAHRWLREAKSVLGTALIYQDMVTAALRDLDEPPPSADCSVGASQRKRRADRVRRAASSTRRKIGTWTI
jgi:hypothetical protein